MADEKDEVKHRTDKGRSLTVDENKAAIERYVDDTDGLSEWGIKSPQALYAETLYPKIKHWLDDESLLDMSRRLEHAPDRVFRGKCLYVVQDRPGIFKIGKASDVGLRLSQMQVGNSTEIRLILTISSKNCSEIERYLHSIYRFQHVRGEWYRLAIDQLKGLHKAGGAWSCTYLDPLFIPEAKQ